MAGKFSRAVVTKDAWEQIRREMRAVRLKETGGALVGYAAGDTIHVTAASGPGPKAILRLFSVEIDGSFTQRFCDVESRKSGGLVDYVGDWHCHPRLSISPSGPDYKAMKLMSGFAGAATRTPITLICSRLASRFSVYLFDGGSKLKVLKAARQRS